jgi:hypothetical protein
MLRHVASCCVMLRHVASCCVILLQLAFFCLHSKNNYRLRYRLLQASAVETRFGAKMQLSEREISEYIQSLCNIYFCLFLAL